MKFFVLYRNLKSLSKRETYSCCLRWHSGYRPTKDKSEDNSHMFKILNNWKSRQDFSRSLVENVLYNDNGLIIFNKPYGISVHSPGSAVAPQHIVETLNSAPVGTANYSLTEALPEIAHALGYSNLTLLKAPERYTSGVAILSSNDEVTKRVHECLKRVKPMQRLTENYFVIAVGVPQPLSGTCRVGFTLKPTQDNTKQAVLLDKWHHNAVLRGEVKAVSVQHRTLCVGLDKLTSLVEVCPSVTSWHFLRVYMAHLLSPALGDNLFGSRVKSVMGVPLSIDPLSDNARMPQKLHTKLLKALSLQTGQEALIPMHAHLHKFTLVKYLGKNQDLVVEAPLSPTFIWTCKNLGLECKEMHKSQMQEEEKVILKQ